MTLKVFVKMGNHLPVGIPGWGANGWGAIGGTDWYRAAGRLVGADVGGCGPVDGGCGCDISSD